MVRDVFDLIKQATSKETTTEKLVRFVGQFLVIAWFGVLPLVGAYHLWATLS